MNLQYSAPVILLLMAGCASAPPDQTTASAKPQNCEREYRTGSNIPVKDCSPAMSDEERQRILDELRSKVRPMTKSNGATPG